MMAMVLQIVDTNLESSQKEDPGHDSDAKESNKHEYYDMLKQAEIQLQEESRQENEWQVFLKNLADEIPHSRFQPLNTDKVETLKYEVPSIICEAGSCQTQTTVENLKTWESECLSPSSLRIDDKRPNDSSPEVKHPRSLQLGSLKSSVERDDQPTPDDYVIKQSQILKLDDPTGGVGSNMLDRYYDSWRQSYVNRLLELRFKDNALRLKADNDHDQLSAHVEKPEKRKSDRNHSFSEVHENISSTKVKKLWKVESERQSADTHEMQANTPRMDEDLRWAKMEQIEVSRSVSQPRLFTPHENSNLSSAKVGQMGTLRSRNLAKLSEMEKNVSRTRVEKLRRLRAEDQNSVSETNRRSQVGMRTQQQLEDLNCINPKGILKIDEDPSKTKVPVKQLAQLKNEVQTPVSMVNGDIPRNEVEISDLKSESQMSASARIEDLSQTKRAQLGNFNSEDQTHVSRMDEVISTTNAELMGIVRSESQESCSDKDGHLSETKFEQLRSLETENQESFVGMDVSLPVKVTDAVRLKVESQTKPSILNASLNKALPWMMMEKPESLQLRKQHNNVDRFENVDLPRNKMEHLGKLESQNAKSVRERKHAKNSQAVILEWDDLLARLSQMETTIIYDILGRIDSNVLWGMQQYLHLRMLQNADVKERCKSTAVCSQDSKEISIPWPTEKVDGEILETHGVQPGEKCCNEREKNFLRRGENLVADSIREDTVEHDDEIVAELEKQSLLYSREENAFMCEAANVALETHIFRAAELQDNLFSKKDKNLTELTKKSSALKESEDLRIERKACDVNYLSFATETPNEDASLVEIPNHCNVKRLPFALMPERVADLNRPSYSTLESQFLHILLHESREEVAMKTSHKSTSAVESKISSFSDQGCPNKVDNHSHVYASCGQQNVPSEMTVSIRRGTLLTHVDPETIHIFNPLPINSRQQSDELARENRSAHVLQNSHDMLAEFNFGILMQEDIHGSLSQSKLAIPTLDMNVLRHRSMNFESQFEPSLSVHDWIAHPVVTQDRPKMEPKFPFDPHKVLPSPLTPFNTRCSSHRKRKVAVEEKFNFSEEVKIFDNVNEPHPSEKQKCSKRMHFSLADIPGQIAYTLFTEIPQLVDTTSLFLLFQQIECILLQVLLETSEPKSFLPSLPQSDSSKSCISAHVDSGFTSTGKVDSYPNLEKPSSLPTRGNVNTFFPPQQIKYAIEEYRMEPQPPCSLACPNFLRQSHVLPSLAKVDLGDTEPKISHFFPLHGMDLQPDALPSSVSEFLAPADAFHPLVQNFYPSTLTEEDDFNGCGIPMEPPLGHPPFLYNTTCPSPFDLAAAAILADHFDLSAIASDLSLFQKHLFSRASDNFPDVIVLDDEAPVHSSGWNTLDNDWLSLEKPDRCSYAENSESHDDHELVSDFGDSQSKLRESTSGSNFNKCFPNKRAPSKQPFRPLARKDSKPTRRRPLAPLLDFRRAGLVSDESKPRSHPQPQLQSHPELMSQGEEHCLENGSEDTQLSDELLQRPQMEDFVEVSASGTFNEPVEMHLPESSKFNQYQGDPAKLGTAYQVPGDRHGSQEGRAPKQIQIPERFLKGLHTCSSAFADVLAEKEKQAAPRSKEFRRHFPDEAIKAKGPCMDFSYYADGSKDDEHDSEHFIGQTQFRDPSKSVKRTILGLLVLAGVLYIGDNRDHIERHSISATVAAAAAWRWLGKFLAKVSKGEYEK